MSDLPERRPGWQDMFVPPSEDPRVEEPGHGEREVVLGFLTYYRQTFELKCRGLDAAGMAARSVPPSDLSLLGLLRHLGDVEHHWFAMAMEGDPEPRRHRHPDGTDASFDGAVADPAVIEEAWAHWRRAVQRAERLVEGTADLATPSIPEGRRPALELREVLVHMIEEYARHCGHADLLRERIDGRVGQ